MSEFGQLSRSRSGLRFEETEDMAGAFFRPDGGNKQVNALYARRLVACWNACVGTSTEWLEQNHPIVLLGPPISARFNALQAQRDELLAALRIIATCKDGQCDDGYSAEYHARAAIESATKDIPA